MTARSAIEIDGISKVFHLASDPTYSMKERLLRLRRRGTTDFRALHPLSVDIPEGQTVGILGHNGSGKSTLLKCIAGILTPSTGEVRLRGRLASLLELGAGFHPELTGRENVFINAAFLGIGRKEISKRFDEIVEFSELQHFIDEPVKHYSSGMYVRLGFAVAVNLDPDILLVDEVLAVGDEVFQMKCINRVKQFQREGRTIVFVTHAADTVREICDRALVLDHGHLVADGAPGESIRVFREHLHGNLDGNSMYVSNDDAPLRITAVAIRHRGTAEGRAHLTSGDPFTITVGIDAREPINDAVVEVELLDRSGRLVFKTDTDRLGTPLTRLHGEVSIEFAAPAVPLLDGDYPLSVRVSDRTHARMLDHREGQHRLQVVSHDRSSGIVALDLKVQLRDNPT